MHGFKVNLLWTCALCLLAALPTIAQPGPAKPKEVFRDSAGNLISNNEFVDLRLANYSESSDPATRTILDDGTIEFRIAKPRQEGTIAPTFDAPDIDAKWINTAELKGKVIVLNFWFIGCAGCMDEIPKLQTTANKFRDNSDVVFIAVSTNTPQDLRRFREREGFTYRHIGQALALSKLFDFAGYPKNIVIGRDGKIVYWRSRIYAWDKFESVIRLEIAK